ncbi:MAG: sigma-70 family RNA polymerase sigma factor [Micrococcales bacterium]|nr:sigma-70 family RNA polymerase sigma factor [Micrococcales bacterium]
MANHEDFQEDPLERLLDKESDEDFGAPEFKEHLADSLTPAVLKDWTAADFASIYVRFRPHLERHARRYLVNPSQVEEVVQDAFLYLMTTLPELDSEVGVLKFLKWKTRLLCLDVIRINSRAKFAPLDDQPEMVADTPEMSLELERADDAAVVSMALAKLQPRHREALIASIYEEKSTEVVADQLGLSENATRQLLFRARSAFKKALIGEVETAGMSAGQILSVAARKAAAESGKYITAAGAFLLVLAVSIGVLPNLNQTTTSELATAPTETSQPQATQAQPEAEPAQNAPEPEEQPAAEPAASQAQTSQVIPEATEQPATEQLVIEQVAQVSAPAAEPVAANEPEPIFSEVSLASILATNVTQAGYYTNSYASSDFLSAGFRGSSVEVFGGTGISAFLDLDIANRTVFNVVYQMWVDGKRYYAVAENSSTVTNSVGSGYEVVLRASDFWVVDDSGNVFDQSPLANAVSTVRLSFDSDGNPVNASMKVSR